MKRVLQFLSQKWVISIIGIFALVMLIWFGGPYLGIGTTRPLASPFNRLLAILVLVVLWGLNNFRHRIKASQTNTQLIDQLATTPEAPPEPTPDVSAEEIAILKERFEDALQRLKQTGFKGRFGKQYLYELPWYVIIGPPGSGKTTLFENSGLEFPLAEYDKEKKISGVGGTRNCDWWFSNDAVLLDTAGRYTTQDSHEQADSGAWLGFLDLLRKYRPQRPLNGIIIAVSLNDLQTRPQLERDFHAHTIRQRVQELYTRLGARFPVYMLFTKCDLVGGFAEFFDDLDKEQRAQVWGTTFSQKDPKETADVVSRFGEEFDTLVNRLNTRLLWRLRQERDQTRRNLLYRFPQQMANLKPQLDDFLHKTFQPSRYEERPWLRGVYFSSGTQQGSPVDRVMGALASSFGLSLEALPAHMGHARSYFINRLFQDVIFQESELAGANVRYERQRLWLQRGAYAGAIGLTAAIIFAWSVSFTRNELQVTKLNNGIEEYQEVAENLGTQPGFEDILTALQYAKRVSLVYGETPEQTPWLMGMGLYQGYRLGSAAEGAYQRVLQQLLLTQIKRRLERGIRLAAREPEELPKILSLYLMLGEPNTLDRKRFRSWVTNDWEKSLPNVPDAQAKLNSHLGAMLEAKLTAQELDQRLLAQAQRIVCDIPLHSQIYARLEQLAEASKIAPFGLANLGTQTRKILLRPDQSVTRSFVPGFYTYDGYHEVLVKEGERTVARTIDENRSICEHKQRELDKVHPEQLLREVRERYFRDYIERWNTFLESIKLTNIRNLTHAVDVLDRLSGPDSPLTDLAKAVTDHTRLERSPTKGLLAGFGVDATPAERKSDRVERKFNALHKLLHKGEDEISRLDSLLVQLRDLHGYVSEIAEASDTSEAAFTAAKARMNQGQVDVIRKLRNQANRLPTPVREVITSAASQSWGAILTSTRGYINSIWRSTVLTECRASLEGRYPLYRTIRREATVADFGRFFGEGGAMASFTQSYLVPFVDTQRWKLRVVDQRNLGLSSKALQQVRRAARIKTMFFQDGGQQPVVRFHLKPLFLNARVGRFLLDLNGQQITYQHGPVRGRTLEWPGPHGSDRVRIVFERLNGGTFSIIKDGPWAWFRLLDLSAVDRMQSADRVLVTFATGGLAARYELRAASVTNPFSRNEVARFRCPESL